MSKDTELTPNGEGERQHFAKILLEEMDKVSDKPEEDLKIAIEGWLAFSVHQKNGNGKKEFVSSVKKKLEDNDIMGAALLFVDRGNPIPLTGSITKSLKDERKTLRLLFTTDIGKRVFIKERASPTFSLGGAAHSLIESLEVTENDLDKVRDRDIRLKIKDGFVTGFESANSELYTDKEGKVRVRKLDLPPAGQETFIDLSARVPKLIFSRTDLPALDIGFSEPIEAPKEAETIVDWATSLFAESLQTIAVYQGLPSRPSEVEAIFDDDDSRKTLMRALEISHIIFGLEHGLSLVDWEDPKQGVIKEEKVDMFAVLNWLALIRKSLEDKGIDKPGQEDVAVLTELKEGNIKYYLSSQNGNGDLLVPVQGKKIDILRLKLKTEEAGEKSGKTEAGLSLKRMMRHVEGQFDSQALRYRSYEVVGGIRRQKSTRLQRNLQSLFLELHKHVGDRVFAEMNIEIGDYKFPGGDGGWAEQYDPEDLPDDKDVRQVAGYMFKVISQLCWVSKWINLTQTGKKIESDGVKLIPFPEKRDVFLSIEEVIDFALSTGILNRVHGNLLYQLPSQEIICPVVPKGSSRKELISWAAWAAKLDDPQTDQRDRLRVARALKSILKPNIGEIEIKRREMAKLPEILNSVCLNHRGKFFLSIEDLEKLINARVENKDLTLFSAIEFTDKSVKVMWLRGLIPGETVLRIAVDRTGRFAISGLKDGVISGRLLSGRRNWGVREKTEKLMRLFDSTIWNVLESWNLPKAILIENEFVGNEVIMPSGVREKLIPGKPIVCKYDLLSGRWYLDYKLLEVAVGSDAGRSDHIGIHELARLLNEGGKNGRSIWCPMPTHNNINTKAAILNEGSINCQSGKCEEHIYLPPRGKVQIESEPITLTRSVEDFKLVSEERQKTFESLMKIGSIFASNAETPYRYITEERGIAPGDLGLFGYIPLELDMHLGILAKSKTFRELSKSIRHKEDYHLGILESLLTKTSEEDREAALASYQEVIKIIDQLPEPNKGIVLQNLNIKSLMAMEMRGILEPGRARLGERIILPTYWISSGKTGSRALVQANFNARGIELNGRPLYKEQVHHKAYLVGKSRRNTPAGFYFKDPESFLLNLKDTVVVSEGPFNAATFSRMVPSELSNLNLTNVGLGHNELVAFLRWLGVYGDSVKEGRGMGFKIKRVVLSLDFDEAGAKSFGRKRDYLTSEFPGLEVVSIHEFLPEDVKRIVPPFDYSLFRDDGKYQGFKLDLNDMIKPHGEGWEKENGINDDVASVIRKIRAKYAYKV